jgi:hypothetical protein
VGALLEIGLQDLHADLAGLLELENELVVLAAGAALGSTKVDVNLEAGDIDSGPGQLAAIVQPRSLGGVELGLDLGQVPDLLVDDGTLRLGDQRDLRVVSMVGGVKVRGGEKDLRHTGRHRGCQPT